MKQWIQKLIPEKLYLAIHMWCLAKELLHFCSRCAQWQGGPKSFRSSTTAAHSNRRRCSKFLISSVCQDQTLWIHRVPKKKVDLSCNEPWTLHPAIARQISLSLQAEETWRIDGWDLFNLSTFNVDLNPKKGFPKWQTKPEHLQGQYQLPPAFRDAQVQVDRLENWVCTNSVGQKRRKTIQQILCSVFLFQKLECPPSADSPKYQCTALRWQRPVPGSSNSNSQEDLHHVWSTQEDPKRPEQNLWVHDTLRVDRVVAVPAMKLCEQGKLSLLKSQPWTNSRHSSNTPRIPVWDLQVKKPLSCTVALPRKSMMKNQSYCRVVYELHERLWSLQLWELWVPSGNRDPHHPVFPAFPLSPAFPSLDLPRIAQISYAESCISHMRTTKLVTDPLARTLTGLKVHQVVEAWKAPAVWTSLDTYHISSQGITIQGPLQENSRLARSDLGLYHARWRWSSCAR